MDSRAIQALIPHRYPLLLVDRILELEPGRRAVGVKNVSMNEEFFQGHFPGRPIMPGVLILEAMAQVGAVLFAQGEGFAGKIPVLGAIERARFRRPVVPGDQLVSELTILRVRGSVAKVQAVARVQGQVVAEAEYMFALVAEQAPAEEA